jgi:hypothetical protein
MVSIMVVIFVKWVCSNQGCNGIDEKRRDGGNENVRYKYVSYGFVYNIVL